MVGRAVVVERVVALGVVDVFMLGRAVVVVIG